MLLYLRLFWEYFKTGLFAVGGGLATLPFLSEIAERTGWFTQAELADMIAVAESTPGPIGVNVATYVGFTVGGIPGAVVATLGLVTPSFLVILMVAMFLRSFGENHIVKSVFACLRPASTGLITAAGLSVAAVTFWNSEAAGFLAKLNVKGLFLAAVLIVLTRFVPKTKKWHPLVWVLCSAVVGILIF